MKLFKNETNFVVSDDFLGLYMGVFQAATKICRKIDFSDFFLRIPIHQIDKIFDICTQQIRKIHKIHRKLKSVIELFLVMSELLRIIAPNFR
jgi:hypothetical protein